jgi:hypothetical protein
VKEAVRLLNRLLELESELIDGGFWLLPKHVERGLREFAGLGFPTDGEAKRVTGYAPFS